MALDRLVHISELEIAQWAAAALTRFAPGVGVLASFALLLNSAPYSVGDAGFDAFRDDPDADVQVVVRQGASDLLLVFTGVGGRAGMALPLAHRWFGTLGVHVVYLRDSCRQAYNDGVRSLGPTYHSTLEGLWRIADGLNARAILTYGNSVGGYGALRFGLDLRARSILAFSAGTCLVPPLVAPEHLEQRRLRAALDLRPFFPGGQSAAKDASCLRGGLRA